MAEKGAGRDWQGTETEAGLVARSGGGARDRGESSACVGLFRDGQGSYREGCQELFSRPSEWRGPCLNGIGGECVLGWCSISAGSGNGAGQWGGVGGGKQEAGGGGFECGWVWIFEPVRKSFFDGPSPPPMKAGAALAPFNHFSAEAPEYSSPPFPKLFFIIPVHDFSVGFSCYIYINLISQCYQLVLAFLT